MKIKFFTRKSFYDFPAAHRQWKHNGHCRFVHGYCRTFHIDFASHQLDENGFVVDLSNLKDLHKYLGYMYDHTTLIREDDPELETFKQLDKNGILQLRIVESCSLEIIAKDIFEYADKLIKEKTNKRAFVYRVTAQENEKNIGIYSPFENTQS